MENIDITDSAFSLDRSIISSIDSENFLFSNSLVLYLCLSVVAILGFYLYNKYFKKTVVQTESVTDCEGGFCTMNNKCI